MHHPAPAPAPQPMLTYLGQSQIPFGATFDGTVIGGLSALSYDTGRQVYYVISDDRSQRNPARFYTVQLSLSDKGIDKVTFTSTHPLLDQSGQPFRPLTLNTTPPVVPPDPEGIAFDPGRQRLYWCSEGERLTAGPVLLDPWVRAAGLDGAYLGQFTLPPNLVMSAQHTGPRRNRALEGLALTPDGRSLFAAMEDPGYNDGPASDDGHGVLTRVTKFDVATGAPTAQYAYPMEPPALPADLNGVSDLVALSDTTFLVVERLRLITPDRPDLPSRDRRSDRRVGHVVDEASGADPDEQILGGRSICDTGIVAAGQCRGHHPRTETPRRSPIGGAG